MKNNDNSSQEHVTILGIKVLSTSIAQLLSGVRDDVTHSRKFSIATPNPELVLASTKNAELKSALNSSTYSIPDGHGLSYAAKFLYNRDLNIIHGRIFFQRLIELANKKSWKVFFLGGKGNEAERAAENLRKNYKSVKIETFAGPILDIHAEPVTEADKALQKESFALINKFSPQILFVAFGNPKQEIWIQKNLRYLSVGGAMAVGGTLRYTAGMSKLPPKWMAAWGLEWLWRGITEPYRLGRILNASVVFPLRIFWFKVSGK